MNITICTQAPRKKGPCTGRLAEGERARIKDVRDALGIPEIEAGILEHYYHERRANRARSREFEAFDIDEEKQAQKRQDQPLPALGKAFSSAERSLSSLARIAATIEGSMYRAIRELERRKAERRLTPDDILVIDVEDGRANES